MGAGLANQRLSYVGDQLILNYTGGETCHNVYQRSTEIYFSCHPDRHPVSSTQRQNILQLVLRAEMIKLDIAFHPGKAVGFFLFYVLL